MHIVFANPHLDNPLLAICRDWSGLKEEPLKKNYCLGASFRVNSQRDFLMVDALSSPQVMKVFVGVYILVLCDRKLLIILLKNMNWVIGVVSFEQVQRKFWLNLSCSCQGKEWFRVHLASRIYLSHGQGPVSSWQPHRAQSAWLRCFEPEYCQFLIPFWER